MSHEQASAESSAGKVDLLHASKITKRFGGLLAVRDVEFVIPEGSIVSLIGPNGAGKTTFFNIVAGLTEPTSGVIDLGSTRIVARPKRVWAEPFFWLLAPLPAAIIAL